MALTETTKVDQLEVIENGTIQIRTATIIQRDGTEISRTFHRHMVTPGSEVTNEDAKVQAVANAIWTAEVIAAYQAQLAAQQEANKPAGV
jgi:hypothetical protein